MLRFLVAFAILRVLVYSAAFPLFNNVDEQPHVDLVVKYARGAPPRRMENIGPDAARFFALYSSPEYLSPPDTTLPPPGWIAARDFPDALAQAQQQWTQLPNLESGEPPLYYTLAGIWFRFGEAIGIRGGLLIYWVRFLNVVPAGAVVLLAWKSAPVVFADSRFAPVACATVCAVLPQDVFYSVASDGWSAVWFGIAFVVLSGAPGARQLATAGLALAATVLTKLSAAPVVALAAIVVIVRLLRARRFADLGFFGACSLSPVALWCAHNRATFGDWTATHGKIAALGWTLKPLSQWLPHPLFTPSGAFDWWRELLASFWRGEFVWHWQRISSPSADLFYWMSATLVLIAMAAWLLRRKTERRAVGFALALVLAGIAFVILLSLIYDFDGCFYPSRAKPYFTSGRLLIAALVPLALLYARAIEKMTTRLPISLRYGVIAAIALFITINEYVISRPAFNSRFNFFEMAADARRGEMAW